jgi:8-amino-3,8-dideoxy-alpha-D-manno-octulosonate transaminase
MDPDDFERKITSKTKAVIVVHFQGGVNNMDRLLSIAKERNILVVEDCAQSCGASYKGNKVGSLGDVSCFSFQQNKTITTGDGGLLLAKDPTIYERAVRFHDLGFVRPSFIEQLGGEERGEPFSGLQFRMNEFTGAVALAQLRKLDCCILDITRRLHRRIREQLITKCTGIKFRQADDIDGDAGIAFYIDLDTPDRAKRFSEALTAEGIRVGPSSSCSNILHDPLIQSKAMVHSDLPPFGKGWPGESVQYSPDLCPNCDRILQSMLCIALVPHMTDGDADDVAEAIVKVWNALPLR